MREIKICDTTLCSLIGQGVALSFKESLEAAKLIEKSGADTVQLPALSEDKRDAITARSIAATLQDAAVAVECRVDSEAIARSLAVLKAAKKGIIALTVPVSVVQMEYLCKQKPEVFLSSVLAAIEQCKAADIAVELVLDDITRGDKGFYSVLIPQAIKAGVKSFTVSDNAGILLPDEAREFVKGIRELINDESISCGFAARNSLGVASANAAAAVMGGADSLKLAFNGMGTAGLSMEQWAQLVRIKGDALGISCNINIAELQRLAKQLESIIGMHRSNPSPFSHIMPARSEEDIAGSELGEDTDMQTLAHRIESLGYDMSDEELQKLYEKFRVLASKKKVHNRDIEALVADMARQIPPTYRLIDYMVMAGSNISATANIRMEKKGEPLQTVSVGDGPVDAAFLALEKAVGCHFELEDFNIQAVTEGREAMGDAYIKLRYNGKLYAGRGIDTDVIGSCIRAYINAVNKILYEEKQA